MRDQQIAAHQDHAQTPRTADGIGTEHHAAAGRRVEQLGDQPGALTVGGSSDLASADIEVVTGLADSQGRQRHRSVGLDVPAVGLTRLSLGDIAQHSTGIELHQRLRARGQYARDGHVLRGVQAHAAAPDDQCLACHGQGAGFQRHAVGGDRIVQGQRTAAQHHTDFCGRCDLAGQQITAAVEVHPPVSCRGQDQLIGTDLDVAATVVGADTGSGLQRDGLSGCGGAQKHRFRVTAGVQEAAAGYETDVAAGAGHAAQGHVAAGLYGQVALHRQRSAVLQQVTGSHCQTQGPGAECAGQGQMTGTLGPDGTGHRFQASQAGGVARARRGQVDGSFAGRAFVGLDQRDRPGIDLDRLAG